VVITLLSQVEVSIRGERPKAVIFLMSSYFSSFYEKSKDATSPLLELY